MRVNCDVCGVEPAAVLCCADEAALCSACDRRVHRANKVAGKHRRVPLVVGGDDDEGPLCDVCRERRALVFCVEDRAILCADCDEPIHSASDLTAKHTRFLLVGYKLSAAAQAPGEQEPSSPVHSDGANESGCVPAIACAQQQAADKSSAVSDSNGCGGAMISDYLTNICPGWRVDDLLFDEAPFSAAATKPGRDEHVPSVDADLFDVVAAGRSEKRGAWGPPSWTGELLQFEKDINTDNNDDSDLFAVPEITPPPAKKARPSSYWCF